MVLVCAGWLQIPALVLLGFEPLPPGEAWERRDRIFLGPYRAVLVDAVL